MIRVAVVADLPEILRMERASDTAPHWPLEEYVGFLADDAGPVSRVLLIDEGVGFAAGSALGREAEIESVAVIEEARRKGYGRALCKALMDWAREAGAVEMTLEVRSASHGARQLYEQLGFVDAGVRPGYYRGPADDAILMRCELQ